MAVEKAKVIARLKALFPKANLSQKRLDALVAKLAQKPADDADDTAIDTVINDFNEVMSIEDIAKEDDRVRSLEAEKAKLIAAKAKSAAPGGGDDEGEETIELPADTPEWAKQILKDNAALKAEVAGIKSGKTVEDKKLLAQKAFEGSSVLKGMKPEIKEKWLKRFDLESETSLEDQAKELETEFTELFQQRADANQYSGPAGSGSADGKVDQAAVDSVLDKVM